VNGSLFRINRDVRFSKDKAPYKAHIDLWFWEGKHRGWDAPGFFFRLLPTELILGTGMHRFDKVQLAAYREAVLEPKAGKALASTLEKLTNKGKYKVGEKARKKVPRGFDSEHTRAELLMYDGLTLALEEKLSANIGSARFVDACVAHYRALCPLNAWLKKNVVTG
jgi:uncharacterized protein (TIGR02453 family)